MNSIPMEWASAVAHPHQRMLLPEILRMLPRGDRLLDLGCGNGWLTEQYRLAGFSSVGMDISQSGLRVASAAFPNVRFLPMTDDLGGPYDCIVASEVIEHLYDPPAMLARCFAALRPGGTLVVTAPYHGYLKNLALSILNRWDVHHSVFHTGGHIKFFSRATLCRMMAEAGFTSLRHAGAGRVPLLWKSMIVAGIKP